MSLSPENILPGNIFQTVFEKSPGSLLLKADAPHFTILAVSDSYLQVTSTTREAILGKGFSEVFPEDEKMEDTIKAQNVFARVIETGQKIDIPAYRYDMFDKATKTYEEHHWSCSNVPINGDNGEIAFILNTVIDITEEVKAKEAAMESEERLRIAAEVTGLATFDMDLRHHTFFYSPRMVEIFGHPPGTIITVNSMRAQIAPEDMENIVRKSFRQAMITGEHLYEVKISLPDGAERWIKTQGVIMFDHDKQPMRMLGTVLDITESKRDAIRKNDFIAMASHELKTPLTSLKSYIQLLAKKFVQTDDTFINNALAKANNQVNKMQDLIYAFLDLSRLEAGKLQIKIQLFDINKLVEENITEYTTPTTQAMIFVPKETVMVYADRERIGQVIGNFLSNAIKYSSKESTIVIDVKSMGATVQVSVTDTGIGIRKKDQEKLFQRFYRVENEQMKHISGFGIGLYLSSEIINRHKGKIGVKSEEGKGSTFFFSLPMK